MHAPYSMFPAMLMALISTVMAAASGSAAAQQARRAPPAPKAVCLVADFRTLALETHDARERAAQAREWLRTQGSACTLAQLNTLASNRAAWLGNADSPTLMGMIDRLVEPLEARNAAAQAKLAAASTPGAALPAPTAAQAPQSTTVGSGTPPPNTAQAPRAANPAVAPVVVPVAVPAPAAPARP